MEISGKFLNTAILLTNQLLYPQTIYNSRYNCRCNKAFNSPQGFHSTTVITNVDRAIECCSNSPPPVVNFFHHSRALTRHNGYNADL